jgi:hypothetical protein
MIRTGPRRTPARSVRGPDGLGGVKIATSAVPELQKGLQGEPEPSLPQMGDLFLAHVG